MNMGVSKFKKGNNDMVVLECDEDKDFRMLKETIMEKLENNFKVTEIISRKPKDIDGFHMRLLKRVKKTDEERANRSVGHQRKKDP